MSDFYIRTQNQKESQGPFDSLKLQSMAEAKQIDENSLYYDVKNEEWVPLALNKKLCAQLFPKRERLKIQVADKAKKHAKEKNDTDADDLSVSEALNDTDGNRHHKKSIKKKVKSAQQPAPLSTPALGIMLLGSAIFLLYPQGEVIGVIFDAGNFAKLLNYPFIMVGLFDLFLGLLLFLSVTVVYPVVRARSMLTLGFGVYVGWALGDAQLAFLAAAAGLGIFVTTMSQRTFINMMATVLGIAANGTLAYLASVGRFTKFFDTVVLQWIV